MGIFSVQAKPAAVSRYHRTPVASQKLGPIDINTDDISPLATLKGIGSKKAKSI
ncbi:helix-hairpin-helix domain-containing protein [Coxiella-like endosymbiont of Rhipicephalus sanguineus]|uniref:helix-hairpin-helix domain-containing protein n=1 Tax=Coxiella-like endosymbiont of Rhipicephalus sanguineus TaxID=1955402 RepID=UPI00203A40ED|nr:helix-hairpin-helix domain-containing protein [Coxiella-like endosymbiont of Rhipicephalus sanguineus]